MKKRDKIIRQARIRAMRKGLLDIKKHYRKYQRTWSTPEQIKQLNTKFVNGSSHSACLLLLQRKDKELLRAFNGIHYLKENGYLRHIDLWLHDQRLIIHYLIHGNLVLGEGGKKFYEEEENKMDADFYAKEIKYSIALRRKRQMANKTRAFKEEYFIAA